MERKHTPVGKTYWNEEGAYQKEYDELYKKLVPVKGEANTVHGEMLRGVSRLYHDYFNNGNGNAVDAVKCDCPECHGGGWETINEGEEDEEEVDCSYCDGECQIITGYEFEDYFEKMLDFIKDNLTREARPIAERFEKVVLAKNQDNIDERVYEELSDAVIHHILTTENAPREIREEA
jgi:hypothetical protein